mmetsp:Transcript_17119/g.53128  ORF Transcript_17119/g.53128 Transcript_17119/m.53128 type:complete len:318 (-) Transcript_17119:124-1077(-)
MLEFLRIWRVRGEVPASSPARRQRLDAMHSFLPFGRCIVHFLRRCEQQLWKGAHRVVRSCVASGAQCPRAPSKPCSRARPAAKTVSSRAALVFDPRVRVSALFDQRFLHRRAAEVPWLSPVELACSHHCQNLPTFSVARFFSFEQPEQHLGVAPMLASAALTLCRSVAGARSRALRPERTASSFVPDWHDGAPAFERGFLLAAFAPLRHVQPPASQPQQAPAHEAVVPFRAVGCWCPTLRAGVLLVPPSARLEHHLSRCLVAPGPRLLDGELLREAADVPARRCAAASQACFDELGTDATRHRRKSRFVGNLTRFWA